MRRCYSCGDFNIYFEENTKIYGKELNLCRECYNVYFLGVEGKPPKFKKCKRCSETFPCSIDKSWAKICLDCWKKLKTNTKRLSSTERREILIRIKTARREAQKSDTEDLQKERKSFVEKMLVLYNIKTCEMYYRENFDPDKSPLETPQYFHEYKFHNTRQKIPSETCAEIDSLSHEKAVEIICKICLRLIKHKLNFFVFYCEGGRSPHIRLYDIQDFQKLTPYKRELAQKEFWNFICPEYIQYLDQGMWTEDKLYCLEYAPHWKHRTPFNLLFEYKHEEEQCNQ